MIRTFDGRYIFGKRSRNGVLDVIGGGAQQDEMEIKEGIDLERNLRKEMFEETGIQESQVELIQPIGIVHSITTNIIFISLVQLNISQSQMNDIFKNRLEDEMSDLVYVTEAEIKTFLKEMPSYRPLIVDLL
jgi:8-oxo-dGTP pyrophosphatase MutT (NUDIX family)